ncbi:hypothetical protein GWI33_006175 [Rhynchophorus ferrugineus]|uniref:Uncharacterized protein n=1 Tax=Rhynchophorus ferrugineus TaxID=354439 RepID=A0A834MJK8_RHYFE|nr:hypothetical protein GWI33_006175 [Rhynchophorus ferrugineus]
MRQFKCMARAERARAAPGEHERNDASGEWGETSRCDRPSGSRGGRGVPRRRRWWTTVSLLREVRQNDECFFLSPL